MNWVGISQAFTSGAMLVVIFYIIKAARSQRKTTKNLERWHQSVMQWQQNHMQEHLLMGMRYQKEHTEGGEGCGTGDLRKTMFDAFEKHMETGTTRSDLGSDGIGEDGGSETS